MFSFACAQVKENQMYSSPQAPVGNKRLTVPSSVKPVLNEWMRDAFVMHGPDGNYYLTGTTAAHGRRFRDEPHCWDYNDGIYMWTSKDLKNWSPLGLVWSFDKDAAEWQKKGKPIKPGAKSVNGDLLDSVYRALWAPELHYIKSRKKWIIAACMNGGMGSFILESTSGKPEGPYVNIPANKNGAIFPDIDLSVFEDEDKSVYLVGHNHLITKMNDDLSDIVEPFKEFKETPYNPEPYIEGVWLDKHNGKYQLLQTVWSVKQPNGTYSYIGNKGNSKDVHSYDVVVSEADNIYGPYGPRYPAILEGGHNNLFKDSKGEWWSTTFFNPRGAMGRRFPVTCRVGLVPVKWVDGKLMPDSERASQFYKNFKAKDEIIK
ncbi:family 43 glycosylhydrolase [Arcticibacter tournemirensis]|uniref:Family 43 glycosylhydrolase n=3 Tax=Arcticibacter tournemirensis TaxID=699437 RepID=A0A5M9H8E1_9SPHI|nr:family 43 glycosylhydrolase [Arcticibacter tournemirensis]